MGPWGLEMDYTINKLLQINQGNNKNVFESKYFYLKIRIILLKISL